MRRYIIKIWEDETMRDLGESDVVEIDLVNMNEAIKRAKHIMALQNYASLEVQTQDEKTTVFAITPEDGEQYFNEEIENIKIQDKINKYYKEVYPGNPIQDEQEEMTGKVKDVIQKLKENQEHVNKPENEVDEETIEMINSETKELIEELQDMDQNDIVKLFLHPMAAFFAVQESKTTLKEVQELYLEHMKDFNITHKDIPNIVEIYFDMNEITDLMEYGADSDSHTMRSLSDLFSEILEELDIPIDDVYTNDGMGDGEYEVTIVFEDGKEYSLDTKAWYTPIEITKDIEDIASHYQVLQQSSPDME